MSILLVVSAGCGQVAATDVAFSCGDAGAVCRSATQYCDMVTAGGE